MNLSDITWPLCNIRITLSGSFLTNPANLTGFLPLILFKLYRILSGIFL